MASSIGIRALRETLTTTIRRVRAGESFEVTHDGVPVALLSPLPGGLVARLLASGDATAGKPLERPLSRFSFVGRLTASEALEEDRAER